MQGHRFALDHVRVCRHALGGGLLAGLGLLVIPGIGPVIAAGPIVAMLAGAGIDATGGGLIGALIGLGVPEEEAHAYAEGVRRGGTLVTVKTSEDGVERAVAILERYGPADIDQRRADWQATGWQRFEETGEAYPSAEEHEPILRRVPTKSQSELSEEVEDRRAHGPGGGGDEGGAHGPGGGGDEGGAHGPGGGRHEGEAKEGGAKGSGGGRDE